MRTYQEQAEDYADAWFEHDDEQVTTETTNDEYTFHLDGDDILSFGIVLLMVIGLFSALYVLLSIGA